MLATFPSSLDVSASLAARGPGFRVYIIVHATFPVGFVSFNCLETVQGDAYGSEN